MKVLDFLDNTIANALLQRQIDEKITRPQTDKLTGSMLYFPLQDQILKIVGVPQKSFDSFTLRKFERGHQVEAWIMGKMPGLLTSEQIVELGKKKGAIVGVVHEQAGIVYRGCTGHIDGIVDMETWDRPDLGIIPHEVKSITNADWNRTFGGRAYKAPEAKWHHKLQAGMYAMALQTEYFMVHYIASDDFRIKSILVETEEIRNDVNNIIDEVIGQLALGRIPNFSPRIEWQTKVDYQNYPDWSSLSSDEATEKLERDFPEAYARLQKFGRES